MNKVTLHKTDNCNKKLDIEALDDLGKGGAYNHYAVYATVADHATKLCDIRFQNGPPEEVINGVTIEVLLAIVVDRLRGFQTGKFPCRQNSIAITKIEESLLWLADRSRERTERGVSGSYEK